MSMWMLLLMALAVAAWWVARRRGAAAPAAAGRKSPADKLKLLQAKAGKSRAGSSAFLASAGDVPFRAVSIQPGSNACASAYALSTQRYLVGETPKVPVEDCTERNCQCRYRHHRDRRRASGDRRAIQSYSATAAAFGVDERRRSRGRRSTDGEAA